MKTKSAIFSGNFNDLDMFAYCGIDAPSIKKFFNGFLKITWICEEDNDVHDLINGEEMEKWNVNLISIHN